MKSVIELYKYTSETPLEAIERFRKENPEYATVKLGYAGRLDPMAEGLLLILVGDENKKKKEYELLPKEYEFSFIPGIETDSYDMMGMIRSYTKPSSIHDIQQRLTTIIPFFIGRSEQPYPPYSSARANGKPLYYWTRRNLLHTVEIPSKIVDITTISFLKNETKSIDEIAKNAIGRIENVNGDFRQIDIIDAWKQFAKKHQNDIFPVFHYSATVSSGTYIRSLVHSIGIKLACKAVTYSITRKKIGEFNLSDFVSYI